MPYLIESPQNPRFKRWKALLDSRGLTKQRQFLLSGRKTVPEALLRYPERFRALLFHGDEQLAGLALPPELPLYRLTPPLYRELDSIGTRAALLVGDLPELARADLAQPPQGLELICALGNPDNLGAMLRSAAAFGASRVILLAEAAHPFHPRALRAAANAQFEVELAQGPRWQDLSKAHGPLLALDAGGESVFDFDWPKDLRLVLGEEGQGLPHGLKLHRLAIPTTGAVESLNASVAASLALFSYFKNWN
jgi:TrmH family RNA methyltransferase